MVYVLGKLNYMHIIGIDGMYFYYRNGITSCSIESTSVSSCDFGIVTESLSPCPTPSMPLCEEEKKKRNCKCSNRPKLNGFPCFPSMGVCKCGRRINFFCEWKCSGDATLPWPTPTPTHRCG